MIRQSSHVLGIFSKIDKNDHQSVIFNMIFVKFGISYSRVTAILFFINALAIVQGFPRY